MIKLPSYKGQSVAVFGLGRSGNSSARALMESGAEVVAWDDNEISRHQATAAGIPVADLATSDWSGFSALILSPGIPLDHPEPHPVVRLARDNGVEIIGDIELLARCQSRARNIGITGTNGKSTTTALIGHILSRAAESQVQVGGNLGVPVLDLEPIGEDGCYVLEMSSYQLDLTHSLEYDVAVLLNLSPDHLDRHGDMAGYIAAKQRIFDRYESAVIGVDDEHCRAVLEKLKAGGKARLIAVSGCKTVPGGIYVKDGILYDDSETGPAEAIISMDKLPRLPGVHNAQNAAAAYATARLMGLQRQSIISGMGSFPGLAHRQELLAVIDGVTYVNDSKATNGEAAARALACYGDIFWIAGGRIKQGGIEATKPYLDRVRHAYLIGEAANDFAGTLETRVPVTVSGELSNALGEARQNALVETGVGAVVLLSPACASFDQFENFESRGEAFRDLVHALPGERREVGT
ncbi:MAG: UDP-N-acetylmuramoyl-L-alanine--D-glutamate ligase [Rhodospirillaceae bacterium]|mgnify:CR=1 FL=1|jgi:UDP-N-acetylmuramoylalanine--D-glutamate ligase|nr:UDP-N-acetylmuramoyl-L-alanine--D-glutamate ligase [Rhodospirillaceae bacterium]MBT5245076.1 UDP-N-acetylmuramoyl-L-alanine--D-glutamate ligase [Rhodospirillaceae bacterium]MBT5562306.1 UDP-N-acetylmuramoyl-L-alanine--D-glutamate ligase [Rhodospirillaceae bacterium]MBT6242703.1 UDP-N-acetylmuramoyl-L-alanine--D-glutamate ligase [Rhodospirillaceae bacterium]MBT7137579.1 UDP-N-acetylmuramoyl-L-alanine--D-glutamate ligase [Rhodospirillaceae bacterium]